MNTKRLLGVLSIFFLGGFVLNSNFAYGAEKQIFTQEDLVSLGRPAVVRIVQKVKGEIVIKPFSLNLDNMSITSGGGETRKIPVDDYMTGSGFLVSADGYILTNSHVVSNQEIKLQYISDAATSAIMDASLWYFGNNADLNDEAKVLEYGKKITDFLMKESSFTLEQNTVVLNPSSKGEKIEELIAEGFPISVESINENYATDGWDMALIKIDQQNLPALSLGESAVIKRGEKIGAFGFPTTAELNSKNLMESTFSQGVVSAIKDSENKDFSIIQTDAKISSGSSGSPLLNDNGEVIGMITYQTTKDDATGGDNFAFAIPIDTVIQGVKKFQTSEKEFKFSSSEYYGNFASGLKLLHEARCQKALVEFAKAKNVNEKFSVSANIETYEKRCQNMIADGKSINNAWDEFRNFVYTLNRWVWFIIIIVIFLFVAVAVKMFFMKKILKKEEDEIVVLEEEIKENSERDAQEMKEIKKIEKEIEQIKGKK